MEFKTAEDLRRMKGREGLVLQGCGGDLQEWVDGMNAILTKAGVLLAGSKFDEKDVIRFHWDGHINLFFPFQGVRLAVEKLAMWRLQTHAQYGGTWFSDYVANRLGGFADDRLTTEQDKPDCPLVGENGNIFHLMGLAARTLREHGLSEQARELQARITGGNCHSYDQALCIIGEYVNITAKGDLGHEEESPDDAQLPDGASAPDIRW